MSHPPDSFGTRLRRQRERQDITLATVAEQTKIKCSLLEELERDNVSHWPTGIFRRAFIRAYARAVGLDQDVLVREFLDLYPDPVEVVETASSLEQGADVALSSAAPPIRLRYLVGSAIESLSRSWRATVQRSDLPTEQIAVVAAPPERPVAALPLAPSIDLVPVARLCSEFGRLDHAAQAAPLLEQVAGLLDAVGLIIWMWDPKTAELKPVLAHGYAEKVVTRLPKLKREADNATAAALRSADTCVVRSSDLASGALAVPMMTPVGCVGVLAIELKHGREQQPPVRALAAIFAAQLARLIEASQPAHAVDRRLA